MNPASMWRLLRGYVNFFFSWRGIPVNRQELVIDIGSGDNPNIRADILCDLYLQSNDERSGRLGIWIDERPFVLCDIHALPFRDKVFDYVVCSHLLEHVEDPRKAVGELTRVGKRGRVETPSKLMETIYGWPFHRWRVSRGGDGRLIFEGKDSSTNGLFSDEIKKSREFEELVSKFPSEFLVRFEWEGAFSVEVRGVPSFSSNQTNFHPEEISREVMRQRTLRRKIKIFLIRLIRRSISCHSNLDLSSLFCCPKCRGALFRQKNGLLCKVCVQFYPEMNGIFFLTERASIPSIPSS